MTNRIDTAIKNREIVRIGDRAGHAVGEVGIALGYNAQYDSVKIGFVDDAGNYTGESTKIKANHVEFIDPVAVKAVPVEIPDHGGCQSNEERSPFSTGRKTCAGEVTARRVPYGLGTSWKCSKHWSDSDRDE